MKKFVAILMTAMLMLSLGACGGEKTSAQESANNSTENISDSAAGNNDSETKDLEAIGDVEVDKGLFNVTLTVPADFADADKTQTDYNALAKEKGYKSITLNADGSLTYVMTKSQHKDLMDEMVKTFQKQLDEMCGSTDYPNFVSIKVNDKYTKFEVVTKSDELDFNESFSVLLFYIISGMYNVFNGTPVDNCDVIFINEASGAVINEASSSDMK